MKFDPDGDLKFQLNSILNEGLELGDNFRGALLEVDLDDGDNKILHGLGFRPIGYIILYKAIDGSVYGTREVEWNTSMLFLRSSVPNQKVRLFVL